MKRIILVYFLALSVASVSSCSHRISEFDLEESVNKNKLSLPTTKGGNNPGYVSLETIHKAQTNHVAILIHGIMFQDGVFVQTLKIKDMTDIGITDEEYEFAQEYLEALNKALHNK